MKINPETNRWARHGHRPAPGDERRLHASLVAATIMALSYCCVEFVGRRCRLDLNPFRAAVPFWGQTS